MTDLNAKFIDGDKLNAEFNETKQINAQFGEVTIVETGDYEKLSNKPAINEITLIGNKTSEELRLQGKMEAMTIQEVQYILYNNEKRRRNNG